MSQVGELTMPLSYWALVVNLVFSRIVFWRWNFFLIVHLPDGCLLLLLLNIFLTVRCPYRMSRYWFPQSRMKEDLESCTHKGSSHHHAPLI